MANYLALPESFPLEEQIKTLKDDELLDFWEETQHLEHLLHDDTQRTEPNTDYERLILQELQVRFQRRSGAVR